MDGPCCRLGILANIEFHTIMTVAKPFLSLERVFRLMKIEVYGGLNFQKTIIVKLGLL